MGPNLPGDWERVIPNNPIPPFSVFARPIKTSEQDEREYRLIQLDNGLKVMLVHDAKADKAAASLDVAVGHLYDPDDMPGLAHFCEHLLFMGTEQFPSENEYAKFLAKNNGASNAYTSTSNTNYYFNVATSSLEGALERFSGFFHSPLFAPSCTLRELNAVDSEHKKNHQTDMWRIFQVNKHLSQKGHVWSKFGSGNRDSLSQAARNLKIKGKLASLEENLGSNRNSLQPSPIPSRISSPAPSVASNNSEVEADGGVIGRETRRRLVDWWSTEYCASRMRLCVTGKESFEVLGPLVSKLFSPIPNRGRDALPMIPGHPFGPEEKGTLVSVQTIMSFHALEISFPLEYQPPFWQHKPSNFLSHFVGHEGPGSLHSYLKNKHWASSLSSGPQSLARGFAMFKITIQLTEEGFKNYRSVVLASFKYLALLRSSQFKDFYQHELVTLSSLRFRFAEKRRPDDYATWVSEHMAWPVPEDLIIAAPQLVWDWDNEGYEEKKIQEYLESFRINQGRVVLMAKVEEHEKLNSGSEWSKEPWYGTGYNVRRWDDEFVQEANGPNTLPELFLPGPNEFIPTNLEVDKREVPEPLKRPHLIRETPLSTLWHKKDDRFWVPKAHVMIDIRSPLVNASSRASVLTRLYSDIVNDSLTEFAYDADLAGLSYSFFPHTTGMYIAMNGYNDKMFILVKHLIEKIIDFNVDPQRLAALKEQARREWQNFFLGQSYSLSDYYGRYLLTERQWTMEEKLRELPSITTDDVARHMRELFSKVNSRILVAGNVFKDEAIKIAELVEENFGTLSISSADLNERALLMPQGANFIWSAPILNPSQANSSLTYYVHFGLVADQRLRVIASIIAQILQEPAFNVLRTREQLGYVVSCAPWTLAGASERGLRIVVQSEKPPAYLEERVDAFLDEMKLKLETMTDEEFEEQKNGLEKKWLEVDKNLGDEVARFMSHINTGHWDFLRNENDARLLQTIRKDDVVSVFLSRVHPASSERSKLSVHMISQKPRPKKVGPAAAKAFESLVRDKAPSVDVNTWKSQLEETPIIPDFVKHWEGILQNVEGGGNVLAALPELVEKYPLEGEGDTKPRPNATYIQDVAAFKSTLRASVDPGPMVQWGDLPVSKF